MINPTTHAITEFPVPTPVPGLRDHGGPRRQPLVHRGGPAKIGMINPTTHAITEFPSPPSVRPSDHDGSDGNLWFTDMNGAIGMINPTTHAITESGPLHACRAPSGSRRGPTATSGSPT